MTKILIVEDEPTIADFISTAFIREGYEVAVVHDGRKVIMSIHSFQPDLITLDLMLPGMDGIHVCRLIRRDPTLAETPIIMVTAKDDDIDRIIGLDAGATDYFTKPFKIRELLFRVQELLRGKRLGLYDEK